VVSSSIDGLLMLLMLTGVLIEQNRRIADAADAVVNTATVYPSLQFIRRHFHRTAETELFSALPDVAVEND